MLIVDRLEEDMAIIEYAQGTFALPICLLPSEIKAGDVIKLQVQIDKEATSDRRARIKNMLANLWKSEADLT